MKLFKLLATASLATFFGTADAQSYGNGKVVVYGDRQAQEIPRPASAGGGNTIICTENPNHVCVQVNGLTDPDGPGVATVFENGAEVERIEFDHWTTVKREGTTEVTLYPKQ